MGYSYTDYLVNFLLDLFYFRDIALNKVLQHENSVVTYLAETLYSVQPDINGYSLAFFVPPDLSGYQISQKFMIEVCNFMTFAAVDITPPSIQVNTEAINTRSGGIPYATEVLNTEQANVTFIDDSQMRIYTLHHMWIKYIEEVTQGLVDPDEKYYNDESQDFGTIDYFGSMYIVKYNPSMDQPLLIGYCAGIFPATKPTRETIGSRTSNEIVMLPITYFCTIYDEALIHQKGHWIIQRFMDEIVPRFEAITEKPWVTQKAIDNINKISKTASDIERLMK